MEALSGDEEENSQGGLGSLPRVVSQADAEKGQRRLLLAFAANEISVFVRNGNNGGKSSDRRYHFGCESCWKSQF